MIFIGRAQDMGMDTGTIMDMDMGMDMDTAWKVILDGFGNTLGSHLRGSRIPIDKIKNQALYIISITD